MLITGKKKVSENFRKKSRARSTCFLLTLSRTVRKKYRSRLQALDAVDWISKWKGTYPCLTKLNFDGGALAKKITCENFIFRLFQMQIGNNNASDKKSLLRSIHSGLRISCYYNSIYFRYNSKLEILIIYKYFSNFKLIEYNGFNKNR